MKVLLIHTTYKLKGGEDSVVANEMELLQLMGVEVELLLFSNTGSTLLKVLQLPFNYGAFLKTIRKLRSYRPDVVHIHNLHFGASASVIYALKRTKIPVVMTLHNYRLLCPSATLFHNGNIFTDSLNKSFSWNAIFKGVYLNSILLTFWVSYAMLIHQLLGTWKLISQYIILGEHTKDLFSQSKFKYLVGNMTVKPNFCFRVPLVKHTVTKYYLYLGRLTEEKGIRVLLQAFSNNGLPLKIAGTGPLEGEVRAHSYVYANIDFLGSVDKTGANELMTGATALIFPSLWYETFGLVIIEAFSAGTPVIASSLGQLKYTITDHYNGLLFEAGNALDLQDKLTYYDSLPAADKLNYQQKALQSYQSFYSPEKNSAQLLDVYAQAIIAAG